MSEEIQDLQTYVEENRESLERVVRHSSNSYARACAWALLDAGTDAPDLETLRDELDTICEMPAGGGEA